MLAKLFSQPVRNLVFLGMLLPSISVSVAAFLAHQDQRGIRSSFGWITQTLQVENTIHQLVAHMVEVENGQRGYLLTERRSYLESYESACQNVSDDLKALHDQIRDSPKQQGRLEKIEVLAADKLEVAAQSIELEQTGQHKLAIKLVRTDQLKRTIDTLRSVAQEMSAEEEMILSDRATQLTNQTQRHARILLSLLALNTLSIASILFLLQRLTHLRSLVKMCAWSRTIEYEGQWLSFEQYLERRFNLDITHGISPTEAEKLAANLEAESKTNSAK
jgi:CHASE3 domain sensor protein